METDQGGFAICAVPSVESELVSPMRVFLVVVINFSLFNDSVEILAYCLV